MVSVRVLWERRKGGILCGGFGYVNINIKFDKRACLAVTCNSGARESQMH